MGRYDAEHIVNKTDKAFWCYCLKSFGSFSVKVRFLTIKVLLQQGMHVMLVKLELKHFLSKQLMGIGAADGKTMPFHTFESPQCRFPRFPSWKPYLVATRAFLL